MRVFLPSFISLAVFCACSSDEPKKPAAPATPASHDAGLAVVAVAPPAVADAGPQQVADAGPPPVVDAGVSTASTSTTTPRAAASAFDRVLAKPKDAGASPDELKHKVERATGKKVASVRKSARTWLLFTFEPDAPARDAKDQDALVAAMQKSGLFSSVEGDRLMQIK